MKIKPVRIELVFETSFKTSFDKIIIYSVAKFNNYKFSNKDSLQN